MVATPQIPVTVAIPAGTPPVAGWPVVIHQHGLGGQRDVVVRLADAAAARGFASIGIDAAAHGYRFFGCTTAVSAARQRQRVGGRRPPLRDGSCGGIAVRTVDNRGFMGLNNLLGTRTTPCASRRGSFSLRRLVQGSSVDTASAPRSRRAVLFLDTRSGHARDFVGLSRIGRDPNASGGGVVNAPLLAALSGGSLDLRERVLGLDPAQSSRQS